MPGGCRILRWRSKRSVDLPASLPAVHCCGQRRSCRNLSVEYARFFDRVLCPIGEILMHVRFLIFSTFFLILFDSSFARGSSISLIPKPLSVESGKKQVELTRTTNIVATDQAARLAAEALNERLKATSGFQLNIVGKNESGPAIVFETESSDSTAPESYRLSISATGIRISGDPAGLFYGVQTLMQILPRRFGETVEVPFITVTDSPRFKYRGMHLDTARHFMPVEFVKKFIDLMAQFKFNSFHWHLTDDQGWRLEIKKYPRLTEIGSFRPETVVERNLSPYIGDNQPHGGFYTQEQIRDVVQYASKRYITIIPEIEMPGHASAALAAYPQFGCKKDYQYKVQTTWGIFKEIFCPTEETFRFLEDILEETMLLFPDSPYIHIGGDEVLKDHWRESEFVQELKNRENLKDEHEVQSYFIRRIEKFVNSKGKKIIGWDEILEGGIAPNATIMSWRGMRGGIEAAKAKHAVIMTPTDYVYFDYGQGNPEYEPLNIGSYVPLAKVYSFEPISPDLAKDEAHFVIGGQANIWTEYMKTPQQVEYMAFPRMLALSEVLWTIKEERNFDDFQRRLNLFLPRLDDQNVNYRIPEPGGLQNILTQHHKVQLTLEPSPETRIHYTTDGTAPDERSPVYSRPIEIRLRKGEVKTLKIIVVNAAGRKSVVYAAIIFSGKLREPDKTEAKQPGLAYELFIPRGELAGEGEKFTGSTLSTALRQFEPRFDLKRPFAIKFEGYLRVPEDGIYEFQVDSVWDTTVLFGDETIIDDAGTKDRKIHSVILPLKAGLHKISFGYNHHGGEPSFRFRWGIKGRGLTQAWGNEFLH
ncbi:MAG: beta-N-acetylhexosaminidase [Blastocatellia bacterium]